MISNPSFFTLLLIFTISIASKNKCEAWSTQKNLGAVSAFQQTINYSEQSRFFASERLGRNDITMYSHRDDKDRPKYNTVEEGSPLGVAIVVMGGSLLVFGGDGIPEVPVWVVLVAASTAAGISRLVRSNMQNK
jgi:hypothetical protein